MLHLFLEVTIFGIVVKGAVSKVTIPNLTDAILKRERNFVVSF